MFCSEESPAALTADELESELAAQAARVDACLGRLLELVAESRRRLDWSGHDTTFATWLAWRCSLLPRQAREHERIAEALEELPQIRGALARGELSYAKVAALARVADAANEEKLLELAEVMTASQLERAVAAYRRVTRAEAAEQQEQEFLTWFWAEDGSLALRGRLCAEDGALLLRSLEAAREALRERRRLAAPGAAHVDEEARVSNVDALVAIADRALAHEAADRTGGERHQVVVHVDARTLARDEDGRCELADGQPLAAETARRLSCDASVVELREHGGETLALGRRRRTVSAALRRALDARDRGCRFPGCERKLFVDAHHVRHWSRGGETNLENLVSLCRRHHRLVHERGYSVKLGDDGDATFTAPNGVVVPSAPRSPPPGAVAAGSAHRRRLLAIDGRTCRNGTGDRMELVSAVAALVSIAG